MRDLDVIVPVFNERKSLKELSERLLASLESMGITYKIIFVDDHSEDSSVEVIQEIIDKFDAQRIIYDKNNSEKKSKKLNGSISLMIKKGEKGKAFSILEAAKNANAHFLSYIDADLQYPPEAIPELYKIAQENGLAIARRNYKGDKSLIRKLGTFVNRNFFGKFLLGFNVDIQSGLKVFRSEILKEVDESEIGAWTLDFPLVCMAKQMGYEPKNFDIDFLPRKNGKSKVSFIKDGIKIAKSYLKIKKKLGEVISFDGPDKNSTIGAGVYYRNKRFITHTRLPEKLSAIRTFYPFQKLFLIILGVFFVLSLLAFTKTTLIFLISLLTVIYALDFLFSSYLLFRSLSKPQEMRISEREINALRINELPLYTILCPLYKEKEVLTQFVEAIDNIDWPKEKLEALLLLEEDDEETIRCAKEMDLPKFFKIVVVPNSQPKTKPKACNYGLAFSKGEYLVIYDAEDRPDPLQLKKAYISFKKSDPKVVCLQSKLNYYNKDFNLLTKIFTAEYSLWFDLILPGLQSIKTTIPLGGTSNHFKTKALKFFDGWDAFNVTEDCDLGARLFKAGYKTEILDSTTYEEANSRVGSWLKQRSRWIKGYLQTYFVHMRDPLEFIKKYKWHALIFQLVIGMRMVFMMINPVFWFTTLIYFLFRAKVGTAIESLYLTPFYYTSVILMVFGNFYYFYVYMIGLAKRKNWHLIKYVFFIPFYWLMASFASLKALYQLIVNPYYWEKTKHGLHLSDKLKWFESFDIKIKFDLGFELPKLKLPAFSFNFNGNSKEQSGDISKLNLNQNKTKIQNSPESLQENNPKTILSKLSGLELTEEVVGGGLLVLTSIVANFLNFVYNAYLGRNVSLADFGSLSWYGSIVTLLSIFTGALGATVSHQSARILGKDNIPARNFWKKVRRKVFKYSFLLSLIWLVSAGSIQRFFNIDSFLPFVLLFFVLLFSFLSSVDYGYLSGNQKFLYLSFVVLVAPIVKLFSTVFLVNIKAFDLIYFSIPFSMFSAFLVGWLIAIKFNSKHKLNEKNYKFSAGFFSTSVLVKVSTVLFLTLDVVLAKHFLSSYEAGLYAILSLAGKTVYFLGNLFLQFINPVVSKFEGENRNSGTTYAKLFIASFLSSFSGFLIIGVLGDISLPVLFGDSAKEILPYIRIYSFGIACFTLATSIIYFHQAKKEYSYSVIGMILSLVQVFLILNFNANIREIAYISSAVGVMYFLVLSVIHLLNPPLYLIKTNAIDLLYLLSPLNGNGNKLSPEKLRILIFNWRDTKHIWSGGAELYIQRIAENWVEDGHKVTIFCGNDGNSVRNEKVNGVQIVRRGGFYLVYIYALFYYLFKFRGKYDVIIDCENGIPFFTPLFSRLPKILLVHHVHGEVFKESLAKPLYYFANFLESKIMPLVYSGVKVVTVSQSTKVDLVKNDMFSFENVSIVTPGVDENIFGRGRKTFYPSILYLGRLKSYKNIETSLYAFKEVLKDNPNAIYKVAGFGETRIYLEKLARELKINGSVQFLGKVSDEEKIRLLRESWVFVYPSIKEGWGITAIEANASGTSVVASKVSGLKDSVKDGVNGFLAQSQNVNDFVNKINLLLSDRKLRSKMDSQAFDWAKQFTWSSTSIKFLEIIKNEIRGVSYLPNYLAIDSKEVGI